MTMWEHKIVGITSRKVDTSWRLTSRDLLHAIPSFIDCTPDRRYASG